MYPELAEFLEAVGDLLLILAEPHPPHPDRVAAAAARVKAARRALRPTTIIGADIRDQPGHGD